MCVPLHVCVYFKKVNWGTSTAWTIRGGKGTDQWSPSQQYTQRPPKPPPQSLSFFYSTSNPSTFFFFCRGLIFHKKTVVSLWNFGLQNTGCWCWWVYDVLLGSPLPPQNKAILRCCSFHYKQLNHVILLTLMVVMSQQQLIVNTGALSGSRYSFH